MTRNSGLKFRILAVFLMVSFSVSGAWAKNCSHVTFSLGQTSTQNACTESDPPDTRSFSTQKYASAQLWSDVPCQSGILGQVPLEATAWGQCHGQPLKVCSPSFSSPSAQLLGTTYNLHWIAQDGVLNANDTCGLGTYRSTYGSLSAIFCNCTSSSDCPCNVSCGCGGNCASVECQCDQDCNDTQYWCQNCQCVPIGGSPIIISSRGNRIRLTSPADGVMFDLNGDGSAEQLSWTRAGSDDGFLVLDRNSNGIIDNGLELFGNFTPQPQPDGHGNGFLALAVYDESSSGGNGDGWITDADSIFSELMVWKDDNHNGVSEPDELVSVADSGIASIELDYRESPRTDQYGNEFRYISRVMFETWHRGPRMRFAVDVYLKELE